MKKLFLVLLALSALQPAIAMQKTPKGTKPKQISQKKLDLKLMWAAKANKKDKVIELLGRGANPSALVHPGVTALHSCTYLLNIEIFSWLLQHGAMPTLKNRLGETVLILAIQQDIELCKLIVSRQEEYNKGIIHGLLAFKLHADPSVREIYRQRAKLLTPHLSDHTLKALLASKNPISDKTAYDMIALEWLKPIVKKEVLKEEKPN